MVKKDFQGFITFLDESLKNPVVFSVGLGGVVEWLSADVPEVPGSNPGLDIVFSMLNTPFAQVWPLLEGVCQFSLR